MSRLSLCRFAKHAHNVVARMVADALTLADDEGLRVYLGLCIVLRAKLTPTERWGLAWAALMACDNDEVEAIAREVLQVDEGAGSPVPPLYDIGEEAASWADLASPEERRAYALACFERLSPEERRAIWQALEKRVAT